MWRSKGIKLGSSGVHLFVEPLFPNSQVGASHRQKERRMLFHFLEEMAGHGAHFMKTRAGDTEELSPL